MPNFSYKGRNQGGDLVNGQLQAATINEAAADLFGRDITPIDIRELKTARKSSAQPGTGVGFVEALNQAMQSSKVGIEELIIFSRQMYSLSKAGMPLDRALRGLEASINNLAMKRVLRDVLAQLEKGLDLTGAFSRHPKVFNQLYLSIIHVGENTGRLDLAFAQVGKYLELERNTTKQVKSATRYPLFVIVAIGIALSIIMMFVIPVFADTFARLSAELPWQTVVLIDVSNFFVAYWVYLVAAGVLAVVMFKRWVGTVLGRKQWDHYKLGFPLVGSIFERIALARFARTFAMMMTAGVPIVQSLGVIARAIGNTYIGEAVNRMSDGISKGEALYQVALKSGMFSPLVLQMISVGEESGNLDSLMEEVADFYDSEVEYDLKRLGAAIEPILIVFIAGMVLILALGVFLPIWDLARVAR
jgi:MSHA biogenesis protein MshG